MEKLFELFLRFLPKLEIFLKNIDQYLPALEKIIDLIMKLIPSTPKNVEGSKIKNFQNEEEENPKKAKEEANPKNSKIYQERQKASLKADTKNKNETTTESKIEEKKEEREEYQSDSDSEVEEENDGYDSSDYTFSKDNKEKEEKLSWSSVVMKKNKKNKSLRNENKSKLNEIYNKYKSNKKEKDEDTLLKKKIKDELKPSEKVGKIFMEDYKKYNEGNESNSTEFIRNNYFKNQLNLMKSDKFKNLQDEEKLRKASHRTMCFMNNVEVYIKNKQVPLYYCDVHFGNHTHNTELCFVVDKLKKEEKWRPKSYDVKKNWLEGLRVYANTLN